jgi:hypothetical protein
MVKQAPKLHGGCCKPNDVCGIALLLDTVGEFILLVLMPKLWNILSSAQVLPG